jgi:hypothetical protein
MLTNYFSRSGGPRAISIKSVGTQYTELLFLYPLVSVGHIVHSGASGSQNMIALFFMLAWDSYRFEKNGTRTRYAELVFLHTVGYVGFIVHTDASGE